MYVWTFWENVESNEMPPLIKLCLKTFYKYLDTNRYELILLNESNIHQYINVDYNFDSIELKVFPKKTAKIIAKTSYYRVKLLKQYGGIWIDIDTILIKNFDFIKQLLCEYDFVCSFGNNSSQICNGFIASNKDGKVINNIYDIQRYKLDKKSIKRFELGFHLFTKQVNQQLDICYRLQKGIIYPLHTAKTGLFFDENQKLNDYLFENTIGWLLFRSLMVENFNKQISSEEKLLNNNNLISQMFNKALKEID